MQFVGDVGTDINVDDVFDVFDIDGVVDVETQTLSLNKLGAKNFCLYVLKCQAAVGTEKA